MLSGHAHLLFDRTNLLHDLFLLVDDAFNPWRNLHLLKLNPIQGTRRVQFLEHNIRL